MKIINFLKNELNGWGKYERVLFPLGIIFIILLSVLTNDNKIALVSAVCGITYTILAGKGKISCYVFGMTGTMLYAILALKNALYGNFLLYACYYFPMEIIGIFKWKQNLNKKTNAIVKTCLNNKERIIYLIASVVFSVFVAILLKYLNDETPIIDALTTVFSVLGMLLTVKRCIEQWYVWTVVNALSVVMWIIAYVNGSNCLATILMWATYLLLGVYFYFIWKKELKN